MATLHSHKILLGLAIFATVVVAIFVIEFLIIKFNGSPVPVPIIPRGVTTYGSSGTPLTYAVLGDSTGVGQGGDYQQGIAVSTAKEIAKTHIVKLQNFAISGARLADIKTKQLPEATALKPDIVLITASANDVTHLTSIGSMRSELEVLIGELRAANPSAKIVLTGSPQMGSVPRFPEPVSSLARARTKAVNTMFEQLSQSQKVTFAYLARETGPAFDAHPDLFAADKFHPTTEGYRIWTPVLDKALATATAAGE